MRMMMWRQRLHTRGFACALWVALCFGVTSAVYLSWLNRLVILTDSAAADWLSMIAGYLMQAAGIGAAVLLIRRNPDGDYTRMLTACAALFAAAAAPAILTASAPAAVCFGLVMNLFCGVIAGFYLCAIDLNVESARRGLVFGGGYAMATVAVGIAALIGGGALLHSARALILYVPLCALMAWMAARLRLLGGAEAPEEASAQTPSSPEAASTEPGVSLALACVAIALISAVKNLGFSFPSADIETGLIPELSRLPYALGLLAAGWINDKSRKLGMACTVAALILPFIMLGLAGEPVSSAICWGLDYLFFGFFSVFRVALFLDIAHRTRRRALAPVGLLMGRLGDAAGTAVSLLLSGSKIALIAVTTLTFLPTVFLFFRLYQRLYEPQVVQQRSEQEVFEAFCLHNDLSAREREVMRMVLDNRTNGEIAEALFITESTVKYHVRNVLQKAGCKNRGELQRKFMLALYPHLQTPDAAGGLEK